VLTNRGYLGLPENWEAVESWFYSEKLPSTPTGKSIPEFTKKFGKIPTLTNYRCIPPDSFWVNFPKDTEIPAHVSAKLNVGKFREVVDKYRSNLTSSQIRRAERVASEMEFGAGAYQVKTLPPKSVRNTSSAYEWGEMLTDKIASWVKEGYVKGPFDYAPFPGFRTNPLMAVYRNEKVRPVINMSAPKNESFNDNVDPFKVEKVWMDTAKNFSYTLKEVRGSALISKFDIKDAYKTIPAKKEDWRLQGFEWLGKYFFETQMIFGAVPSVCNFDRLGNTLVELAVEDSGISRNRVLRTLDDIPVVGKEELQETARFSDSLQKICSFVGLRLAEDCPFNDKAFRNQKHGIVLGIGFKADSMEWWVPQEKADRATKTGLLALDSPGLSLEECQSLMGTFNDVGQLCPFMRQFLWNGNRFMSSLSEGTRLPLPEQAKADLRICLRILESARDCLPIASRPVNPPLGALVFYSDAAGDSFVVVNGERISNSLSADRGVACLQWVDDCRVGWWTTLTWPDFFLKEAIDNKGARLGCKSTTLECIGILLPFLASPELVRGKHVVFKVDNMAVVFGWENSGVRFDETATIILRAVRLTAALLGTVVHVQHVPRVSNKPADLADQLSRRSSTTADTLRSLGGARRGWVKGPLTEWLKNPVEDWGLPFSILAFVKSIVQ